MTRRLPCIAAAAAVLSGCASSRPVDRQVTAAVTDKARREAAVTSNVLADAAAPPAVSPPPAGPLDLDLDGALRLATRYSRDLVTRRETLYRAGLSLLRTRRAFGTEVSSTLAYVFDRDAAGEDRHTTTWNAGAGRKLPTGGALSVAGRTGAATAAGTNGHATSYGSAVSVRVEQPLLAGAGYDASHEALTQSERQLVYDLRAFALARQDFAIGILKQYLNLLVQQAVLENTRANVRQSTMLRTRSEAMFRVGRSPAIDVLRAQQQELSASNALAQAESDFDVAQRRFLIDIGLPPAATMRLAGRLPERRALGADQAACVAAALERRTDLRTVRDRLDDARRRLQVARNGMLPELDAFGEATWSDAAADALGDQRREDSYRAGVTLKLPIDKRPERYSLKEAELDVGAARREAERKADEVRIEVADNFSRLLFLANAVEIERRNIEIAEKRQRNALQRFRNGELTNRDVVEAENELLNARNAYARALVQYEGQRVDVLRNSGALDVAVDGTLVEQPVGPAPRGEKGP